MFRMFVCITNLVLLTSFACHVCECLDSVTKFVDFLGFTYFLFPTCFACSLSVASLSNSLLVL